MLLYHFVNRKYALENLAKRRLKISEIEGLNDPFELLAINIQDKKLRKLVKQSKDAVSRDSGIICFSKSWRSPLQWAHYADRHRGLCLGFEVKEEQLEMLLPVKYVKNRKVINASELNAKLLFELLSTKYDAWKHEEEYRLVVPLGQANSQNLYFKSFSSGMKLREVLIGAECDISETELRNNLGDLRLDTRVMTVRPAFGKFEMVHDLRKSHFYWL